MLILYLYDAFTWNKLEQNGRASTISRRLWVRIPLEPQIKFRELKNTVEDGDGNVDKTITLITQDKKRT